MGFEKEGSKSGAGYVGGFFHLFDWTAKSRKKLFSSNSDVSEHTKQGKMGDRNLPVTRLCLRNEDENDVGVGSSIKGSSDYSCASSVTDEEGYGARAPSIVARLMGLDSLPSSSSQEPYSTMCFDTQSVHDVHYNRQNFDYYHDHRIAYSGDMLNKVDSQISRNFIEPKPHKFSNNPIEKFQTEILPPKSAKSIPITHHKLLSPIKSHGYVPSKNADHIMEAAAKMIEPGPQATAKARLPLVGSASVPLKVQALREKVEAAQKAPLVGSSSASTKVRDLKEKVESSQKTCRHPEVSRRRVESKAAQYLKGQPLNRSWNGPHDTPLRASTDKEEDTSGFKNKGKSVSLAVQAKVNVQKREGMNSERSEMVERDQSEAKSSQIFRCQQSIQKNLYKKPSMQNGSGILRQNNQKQNSIVDKDKFPSKSSVPNSLGRKLTSTNSSVGRQKSSSRSSGNCKITARKSGSETIDGEKEYPYSCSRNLSRKKRSINGNFQVNKIQTEDHILNHKSQKSVNSNPNTENHYSWAEESRKKGTDVVSFTFTTPLTRSMPGSEISGNIAQERSGLSMDHRGKRLLLDSGSMKLSSFGYSDLGGDALSFLLEEKLRELTNGLQSSSLDSAKSGSASSTPSHFGNKVSVLNADTSSSEITELEDQHMLAKDKFGDQYESESSSNNPSSFRPRQKFQKQYYQKVDEIDECGSSQLGAGKLRCGRYPSPISILEPSVSNESCDSSVSTDSNCTEGSKLFSSILAQEVYDLSSAKKLHSVEADTELSDSASSTAFDILARKHATVVTDFPTSTAWELDYVKEIVCNIELVFKDFASGRTRDVINPHLFDLLESKKGCLDGNGDQFRLRRKVLFDSVSECLDLRCKRYAGGGYREWAKGVAILRRKEWLAEEVYKEISGWKGMADSMVDELVDKDMSSQFGRWQEFDEDTYILGVEVEVHLFNSLIDELVADIFLF